MDSYHNKTSRAINAAESEVKLIRRNKIVEIKSRFKKRYASQDVIFSLFDLLTSFVALFAKRNCDQSELRRVIIANGGRLGDQIITARIIFALKNKYPNILFDVLTQSSNIELHRALNVFECIVSLDHWYFSKRNRLVSFFKYYLKSIWVVASNIKKRKYDLAIDLRYSYPNAALPLFLSGVPYSIGIKRVGFASMYSKALPHVYTGENEFDYQKSVLENAGFEFKNEIYQDSILNYMGYAAERYFEKRYVIIHPCGSSETKDVPFQIWDSVIKIINRYGYICVITGSGTRDECFAKKLMSTNIEAVSLVNQLSLSKTIDLVVSATLVISVDTFMGHLGAAFGRPVISFFGGFNDFMQWMPYGKEVSIITNPLDCSPCFQHRGCSHNLCIKGINEKVVLDRLNDFFLNQKS